MNSLLLLVILVDGLQQKSRRTNRPPVWRAYLCASWLTTRISIGCWKVCQFHPSVSRLTSHWLTVPNFTILNRSGECSHAIFKRKMENVQHIDNKARHFKQWSNNIRGGGWVIFCCCCCQSSLQSIANQQTVKQKCQYIKKCSRANNILISNLPPPPIILPKWLYLPCLARCI